MKDFLTLAHVFNAALRNLHLRYWEQDAKLQLVRTQNLCIFTPRATSYQRTLDFSPGMEVKDPRVVSVVILTVCVSVDLY